MKLEGTSSQWTEWASSPSHKSCTTRSSTGAAVVDRDVYSPLNSAMTAATSRATIMEVIAERMSPWQKKFITPIESGYDSMDYTWLRETIQSWDVDRFDMGATGGFDPEEVDDGIPEIDSIDNLLSEQETRICIVIVSQYIVIHPSYITIRGLRTTEHPPTQRLIIKSRDLKSVKSMSQTMTDYRNIHNYRNYG